MATDESTLNDGLMLTTFYLGDLQFGLNIQQVQEINRHVEATPVPHAPSYVRGVVNLRGHVVTIIDLHGLLQRPPEPITPQTRTVIVRFGGEQIGLLVDRIGDVVTCESGGLEPAPANVSGVDGNLIRRVYRNDRDLIAVLDIEAILGDACESLAGQEEGAAK